ncbi:MAG TPA: protease [Candidatus Marinimicrobia bacterium]|nr:protease [Candidatus Neomarinimicrobiota bacterium]
MNRKRIILLSGSALLVLLGIVIGQMVFQSKPERIVLYENYPKENSPAFVHASYVTDDNSKLPSLLDLNEAFVNIAENVNPSVVTIITTKVVKMRGNQMFPGFDDDFFPRFFGVLPETERRGTALGSGVIVDKKGYILTNNHVVEQGTEIRVKLIDKREFEAEVIGTDPKSDLAVIKIKADDLTPIVLGDSDVLRVGEWVMAIGSPFSDNLDHTVTAGIVSAKGRSNIINSQNYESFIQTDAAINPGNSGGALVNIRGELVGINTAIATSGGSGNLGIGFAIPINLAKKVMTDLIKHGKVIRAWLGVSIQNVDDAMAKALKLEDRSGVLIGGIVKDGPAKKAGLKIQDVIVEFDGVKVKNVSHLQLLVSNSEVGKEKEVVILRGKKEKRIKVKLEELPDSIEQGAMTAQSGSTRLGLTVEELTPDIARQFGIDENEEGVVVTRVDRDSEAGRSLRTGDLIQRVGDRNINSVQDYNQALEDSSGEYLLVLVKRRDATFFVTLKNAE